MSALSPTELQLDALREVANVGLGHAANALSRLVGGRAVRIDVPQAAMCSLECAESMVGGAQERLVAGRLGLEGGLTGEMLLILPEPDAKRLCALLLGAPGGNGFGNAEESAVGEVANIVASACLTALSALTGLMLLPTPPRVIRATAREVLAPLFAPGASSALVLEARFVTDLSPPFSGQLLLIPDAASLGTLLDRLGV